MAKMEKEQMMRLIRAVNQGAEKLLQKETKQELDKIAQTLIENKVPDEKAVELLSEMVDRDLNHKVQ